MVDFSSSRGSEQAGVRPAVVISNDVNNQHSPVVIVAAITRTIPKKVYPQNAHLPAGPLPDEGTILGGQLTSIAKVRLNEYRGELDSVQMGELQRALVASLGL